MIYSFGQKKYIKLAWSYSVAVVWLILYIHLNITYEPYLGYVSTMLLLIQAFVLIARAFCKKNTLLFVLFSFIALYTWPAKLFFFNKVFLSAHNQQFTYETATLVTLLFSLFLLVVDFFVKIPNPASFKRFEYKNNTMLFYILYIVSWVLVFSCRRVGNAYDGSGDEIKVSTLNEYVLILFLTSYIYSSGNKTRQHLLFLLWAVYIMFTLLAGGRVEVVLLLLLLLIIKYQYVFSFKKIVLFFICGIWGMSVFETIRQNPQMILQGDFAAIVTPFVEKEYIQNSQGSNTGDVYWATERMILLINDGDLSIEKRTKAALYYFLSSITPTSYLPPLANLANYKSEIRTTGGGGLSFGFFYVMFGLGGVVFLGYFFAKMLNKYSCRNSSLSLFYITLMMMMIPRWFAYTPIHLVKFCVWGVLFYYWVICVDYTMKKHKLC